MNPDSQTACFAKATGGVNAVCEMVSAVHSGPGHLAIPTRVAQKSVQQLSTEPFSPVFRNDAEKKNLDGVCVFCNRA